MDFYRFSTYSTEDFITDEAFRGIVKGGFISIEDLKDHVPLKRAEIDLAVEMLGRLQNMEFQQSPERKFKQWNTILKKHKRSVRLRFFRYAAAILLIVGGGSIAFYHSKQSPSIEKFVSSTAINFRNTELILADGKHIGIGRRQSNIKYSADGKGVLLNDTTEMKQSVSEDAYNQMIVPHGKRSQIVLSDGTKVWINSGSRLVYLPVFKANIREVFLEGEAYFEVAKDAKKPFYVRTDAYSVKVYGTKFDVQAYKVDNEYNTILLEGKVSLKIKHGNLLSKEHFLSPNHKACLSADKEDILISEVADIDNYTAWKDGYLVFKNEAFPELLTRVAHYYNIRIEVNPQTQIKYVSGKLDLKENPERVLDGLAVISKARYVKQDNKYVFYE
jgi:transmembrane sensor